MEKLLTVKWTPVTSITLGPSLERKKKNACDFFTHFAWCMKHWGKVQSNLWNYKSHFECNEANCWITFLTTSYARVTKLEISCSRGNILPRRTWLSPSCTCSLSAPEIKKKKKQLLTKWCKGALWDIANQILGFCTTW